MSQALQKQLKNIVDTHLQFIYEDEATPTLSKKLIEEMGLNEDCHKPLDHDGAWSERDIIAITYGDSIKKEGEAPLKTLHNFYTSKLSESISGLHILPFFPYSSDDGFSVIDYTQVNDALGDWGDINALANTCDLMSDLVINHCSSRSRWFENFKNRKQPGLNYFFEADPNSDLSAVVRPRTSPLLREVETLEGKKNVWCTFSHDQVDFNFQNPEVLIEFVRIIKFYLDNGIRIFRLDAVAFLWKELGTSCINQPKTHEVIRLLRSLIEHHSPRAILITETNIPNVENLSYFGNANEAHAVYNFSLPPLLLHALVSGNSTHLKRWQMCMPPAQLGTFYFNFIASHDGIGLRPAEGLLSQDEIGSLVNTMKQFGGRISWRSDNAGQNKPYEINIALYDALQGTEQGPDQWQLERYLCAHAIMLSLEGIPAFYIHSLVGTQNYYEGVELSNHNRAINRYKWPLENLEERLNGSTHHAEVFSRLKKLIDIRSKQTAFHPNATQFTLHLNDALFGFWRQSLHRDQSIFCLHNLSDQMVSIPLSSINLISMDSWIDLISGKKFVELQGDLHFAPYQCYWLSNKIL